MKGFLPVPGGGIELISHAINKKLNIPIAVLMGANLAPEVADEKFCETTIGAASLENGNVLRDIIQTEYFRVVVVNDVEAVEMCGALKVKISQVQLIAIVCKLTLPSFVEYCGLRCWICRWPGLRRQHKGSRHPFGIDGDD